MKYSEAAYILAKHRGKKKRFSKSKIESAALVLGRAGGLVGGNARAEALTYAERSEIASHAANARWGKPCGCSYCR